MTMTRVILDETTMTLELLLCNFCNFCNCSFSFKIYNYMLLCTVMWLMLSHVLIYLMR